MPISLGRIVPHCNTDRKIAKMGLISLNKKQHEQPLIHAGQTASSTSE